jgi:hypothetical protein
MAPSLDKIRPTYGEGLGRTCRTKVPMPTGLLAWEGPEILEENPHLAKVRIRVPTAHHVMCQIFWDK